MRCHRFARFTMLAMVLAAASDARAQSIGSGLSALLTEQTPPPEGYVRDRVAADATFATVASLMAVELSSLPVASSSGGFVYRFNPSFGTVERASDSFGPFFSERALRNGRGRLLLGLSYQYSSFETLQGADLGGGTFPTNTARFIGQLQPFSVDTLSLTVEAFTATGVASYGITDRLDVGVTVPVTRLRFSGSRVNTFLGQSTLQSQQSGSATGLADVTVNARYRLAGASGTGLAVGTDVRFPTGREEDLLGAGATTWRLLGIASWERGRVATHANGGFSSGGVSDEAFWSGAIALAVGLRLSLVGEVMGRHLSELNRVADIYQPHPVLEGIETMRWLPAETGVHIVYVATGFKWNVTGGWLLNVQVLTRVTDAGLRAQFTPSVALDYGFGF